VPILVPVAKQSAWRNRKGWISQNVLAACDFDINFVYILPGWEGSVYDGRVLSFAKDRGFYILLEKYYLVDAGYAADNPLVLVLY
jgi:predicted Rdx family selenoprotein